MPAASTFLTIGVIADRLNEPIHRIEYVLRTRDIKPLGVAGVARVFNEADFDRIAEELRRIDERKDEVMAET